MGAARRGYRGATGTHGSGSGGRRGKLGPYEHRARCCAPRARSARGPFKAGPEGAGLPLGPAPRRGGLSGARRWASDVTARLLRRPRG